MARVAHRIFAGGPESRTRGMNSVYMAFIEGHLDGQSIHQRTSTPTAKIVNEGDPFDRALMVNGIPIAYRYKDGAHYIFDIASKRQFNHNPDVGHAITYLMDMLDVRKYGPYTPEREVQHGGPVKTWEQWRFLT